MNPKKLRLWGPVCWDDQCSPPAGLGRLGHCAVTIVTQFPKAELSVWAVSQPPPPQQLHHLSQGWDFALLSEDPAWPLDFGPSWPGSSQLLQGPERVWEEMRFSHPSQRKHQRPALARWSGGRVPKPVFLLLTFRTVNVVGHAVLLPHRWHPAWLCHPKLLPDPLRSQPHLPVSVDRTL